MRVDRGQCTLANENVGKAFELLIDEIEKSQNPNVPTQGGKCILM